MTSNGDAESVVKDEAAKDEDLKPRDYQSLLLQKCIETNTILYLPTGSGKTYIAVMLIKHMAGDLEGMVEEGGKRTFFMVNTVALVSQQADYIRRHTPLSVCHFSGDMNVDYWSKEVWLGKLNSCKVVVMTTQIFRDILLHNYISLSNVNLLIFDECHHGVSAHNMAQVMDMVSILPTSQHPRILGLTATILNSDCKIDMVQSELERLERTYKSSIATVDDMSKVKLYSTNPREFCYCHKIKPPEPVMTQVRKQIVTTMEWIMCAKLEVKPEAANIRGARIIEDRVKVNKKLRNIMEDVWYHIEDLGLYGGSIAAIKHIIQLERLRAKAEDAKAMLVYLSMITALNSVRKLLEDEMSCFDKKCRIFQFSSPKVLKLIQVLRMLKPKEDEDPPRGIIFVERRFTAKVICMILKYLKEHDADFKFLSPDFMVGFQNNPYNNTREGLLEKKWNIQALYKFNRGYTNIIVSSDVLEEGIDIPQCNVVVKFDIPKSYRSYIQSKGRARSQRSMYAILVPETDYTKFNKKYLIYQEMEAKLMEILRQRKTIDPSFDKPGTAEENNREYCVQTAEGTSRVTMNSAISLVNRYCSVLPQDRFTLLAPTYYIKNVIIGNTLKLQCILSLPINSRVKEAIEGEPMPNQRLAKQSVALETCKALHKAGDLNDHLLPVETNTDDMEDDTLFVHWEHEEIEEGQARPGTKKSRRSHEKKLPVCLCECTPQKNTPAYLHVLEMKPAYQCPTLDDSRKLAFYELLESSRGFAMLSSKKLPQICSFPIFLNVGPLDISMKPNHGEIVLSDEEIQKLRAFNTMIFYDLLKLCKSFMTVDLENQENSYFMVPTKLDVSGNHCIDWDIVNGHSTIPEITRPSDEQRANICVTRENYHLAVVAPWYRSSSDQMYVVTKICTDMTPSSPFPTEEYTSFEAYYDSKYNERVKCPDQPLIEVKAISNKINCLRPRISRSGQSTSKRKRQEMQDDFEEHFIPELCFCFSFPSALWLKATCLPSVLHRMTYLLFAEELRLKIGQDTGLPLPRDVTWEALKVDKSCLVSIEPFISNAQANAVNSKLSSMRLVEPAPPAQLENSEVVPWNHEEEPIDIDREFLEDFTLVDVIYYDEFINKPIVSEEVDSRSDPSRSPSRQSPIRMRYPVDYKVPIHILEVDPSGVGPQQYHILQALTTAHSADVINMERLETLGDSFLKFSVSLFLYQDFPHLDEGKLTLLKGKMVGNRNLFYCGRAKELGSIIKVQEFSPRNDWIPPGICVPRQLQTILRETNLCPSILYELQVPREEQLQGILGENTRSRIEDKLLECERDNTLTTSMDVFIGNQVVADKSVADCVEAILGAYLKGYGVEGAAKLLGWFGIIPPVKADVGKLLKRPARSALIITDLNKPESVGFHLPANEVVQLEEVLGYHFKDRSFLLQALTHASYIQNRVTDCYQRLEFLGDAILDFLITCHIYETCDQLSPGELTDLRSALVNNITFGCLAVRNNFHQYCKYDSVRLFDKIDTFVRFQERQNHQVNEKVLILVEESDCKLAEAVDVPKVLGDLFESLAAAVFLDSGNSLKEVWRVFYRLMKKEIDEFRKSVPKQPVRLLYEKGYQVSFHKPHLIRESDLVMVQCEVQFGEEKRHYFGVGDNKINAKRAAAKLALKDLR